MEVESMYHGSSVTWITPDSTSGLADALCFLYVPWNITEPCVMGTHRMAARSLSSESECSQLSSLSHSDLLSARMLMHGSMSLLFLFLLTCFFHVLSSCDAPLIRPWWRAQSRSHLGSDPAPWSKGVHFFAAGPG